MLEPPDDRSAWAGPYKMAFGIALGVGVLTIAVALLMRLPLRDPDGLFGPSYVRLPLIAGMVLLADVLTRTLARTRSLRRLVPAALDVARERWPRDRLVVALVGLCSFYICYVAYRNLKSFLPFVRGDLVDDQLDQLDRWLMGGWQPGELLHQVLGTGAAAGVLSWVYLFFLFFVPFSVALALVWRNDLAIGSWYVTALCLNWVLGAGSYYLLPSVGPAYAQPWEFADLPETGTSALQQALLRSRAIVLTDPHATERVHGVAAFASLHVSITFTAALVAQMLRFPSVVKAVMWTFFALTAVATIYFGWHYIVDDVAGVMIGGLSVWLAGIGTGRWGPGRAWTAPPVLEPAGEPAAAVAVRSV